jgi:hypothetical protein
VEDVRWFVDRIRSRQDCVCEHGLTDAELDAAEARFSLRFPPLWRDVLSQVHPVAMADGSTRFPDWRLRRVADTIDMMIAPLERLLDDVEINGFWWPSWGPAPDVMAERLAIARIGITHVPILTPLWDHWYIGDHDLSPVFSVAPGDVFVAVPTLRALVVHDEQRAAEPVPFWSDLAPDRREGAA